MLDAEQVVAKEFLSEMLKLSNKYDATLSVSTHARHRWFVKMTISETRCPIKVHLEFEFDLTTISIEFDRDGDDVEYSPANIGGHSFGDWTAHLNKAQGVVFDFGRDLLEVEKHLMRVDLEQNQI
jgi:hypothetical protein